MLTSSNFNGISGNAVIPSFADFNAEIVTCGKGVINEKTGLHSTFLNATITLDSSNELFMDLHVGKPLYLKYYAALDNNLQRFCSQLLSIIGSQSSSNSTHTSQLTTDCNLRSDETLTVPNPNPFHLKLKQLSLCTQRFHLSASPSSIEKQTCVNIQYQAMDAMFTMGYSEQRFLGE